MAPKLGMALAASVVLGAALGFLRHAADVQTWR